MFEDGNDDDTPPISRSQKDTNIALKLKQIELNQKAGVIATHEKTQQQQDMKSFLEFSAANGMTSDPRYLEVSKAYADLLYQSAMAPKSPVVVIEIISDDEDNNCSSSVKTSKKLKTYHRSVVESVQPAQLGGSDSSSL
jgi:hypothetical protein